MKSQHSLQVTFLFLLESYGDQYLLKPLYKRLGDIEAQQMQIKMAMNILITSRPRYGQLLPTPSPSLTYWAVMTPSYSLLCAS